MVNLALLGIKSSTAPGTGAINIGDMFCQLSFCYQTNYLRDNDYAVSERPRWGKGSGLDLNVILISLTEMVRLRKKYENNKTQRPWTIKDREHT